MRFLIYILLLISYLNTGTFAQGDQNTWDFPVKPGTEKWKALKSNQEMINMCQIPVDILKNLSTARLAELCINYPLLSDMLLTSNYQEGFEKTSSIFNGFQELINRKDGGVELFKLYMKFDVILFEKNKKTTNLFLDMCMDVIMAQPSFLEQLNTNQERQLIEKALKKLKDHEKIGNSIYHQKTTTVVLSRILTKNNKFIDNINVLNNDNFLLLNNYFILVDSSFINIIKQTAENFLTR